MRSLITNRLITKFSICMCPLATIRPLCANQMVITVTIDFFGCDRIYVRVSYSMCTKLGVKCQLETDVIMLGYHPSVADGDVCVRVFNQLYLPPLDCSEMRLVVQRGICPNFDCYFLFGRILSMCLVEARRGKTFGMAKVARV